MRVLISSLLQKKEKAKDNTGKLIKTLFALSIPTMTEEILSTLLQYADTAMVGRLGEKATASVSVTTTIGWLTGALVYALGTGILSLTANAYGAKDKRMAGQLSFLAVKLSVFSGIIIGAISLLLSPVIPAWMGAEEEIRQQASIYYAIISVPMIFRSISAILGSSIRAVQNTKDPMKISIISNIVNIVLDFVLIYPANLGVTGAAIATAISYTLSGILTIILFRRTEFLKPEREKGRAFSLFKKTPKAIVREYTKVALPLVLSSVVSCLGYVVFAALVSRMGTTVFAAHSIAVNAETIFYIPGYGLRTASAALIGAAIGEGDQTKKRKYCIITVAFTVLLMCLTGVTLFFTAGPLMSLFTPSDNVISLGAHCLRLVAFSEPFFGLMVAMEGIFYGNGKTLWPFVVETISMWGIRIAGCAVGINYFSFDLSMVWYVMIIDNIVKAVLLALPFVFRRYRRK